MGTDSNQRNSLKRTRDQIGAMKSALNSQLKQGLQEKIQLKRAAQGLGELKVEFETKSPEPLSEQERLKEIHRKESNRKSADRCRRKAKEENVKNEKMLKEERLRKEALSKRLQQLQMEREKLLKEFENKGLILNYIEDRMQAEENINDNTNRTLGAITAERSKEDQESVCYLQNSEYGSTNSGIDIPSQDPRNVSVIRYSGNNVHSKFMNGHEVVVGTVTESDVITGNDVLNRKLKTDVTSFTSDNVQLETSEIDNTENEIGFSGENGVENYEFEIIDAENLESGSDVNDDGNVIIYICFGEEAPSAVTRENVEPVIEISDHIAQVEGGAGICQ